MRSLLATLTLTVELLAFSSGGLAAASSSYKGSAVYRHDGVAFRYPSAWTRANWCWDGMEITPLVVLTSARKAPSCDSHTPFPPAQRLGRNAVSVWWEEGGMPDLKWFSTVANSSTIPVGGEPARSAAITPGSGTWQATGCGKVEG